MNTKFHSVLQDKRKSCDEKEKAAKGTPCESEKRGQEVE